MEVGGEGGYARVAGVVLDEEGLALARVLEQLWRRRRATRESGATRAARAREERTASMRKFGTVCGVLWQGGAWLDACGASEAMAWWDGWMRRERSCGVAWLGEARAKAWRGVVVANAPGRCRAR